MSTCGIPYFLTSTLENSFSIWPSHIHTFLSLIASPYTLDLLRPLYWSLANMGLVILFFIVWILVFVYMLPSFLFSLISQLVHFIWCLKQLLYLLLNFNAHHSKYKLVTLFSFRNVFKKLFISEIYNLPKWYHTVNIFVS